MEGGKKGGPSKADRQHSAVCFLNFIMTEAGVWTALVGRWTPLHFLTVSTMCMAPACIKYTARLSTYFVVRGNRISGKNKVTKMRLISEMARALAQNKTSITKHGWLHQSSALQGGWCNSSQEARWTWSGRAAETWKDIYVLLLKSVSPIIFQFRTQKA